MLRVRLLGELEVRAGDRKVEPPASRRAWELLGWLALHPGVHPRGVVAAQFWPDVLDSSARASLRSAAWALRRALGEEGEGALTGGRDRIGLDCETDLAAFDADVAAGRLEAAVGLCAGPLLADLDQDWVLGARDEHAERLGGVLTQLATAAPTPQAAVTWARQRVALDPLDEKAARALMRSLVAADDRAGALAVYDRVSERLRTALGLAPSARTRALAAEVRTAPGSAPPGAAIEAVPAEADGPPLVGRDADLATLVELWERVRAGSGGVVVIGGEGGIGKTRLADELAARARAQGARIARCTALDLGGGPPFGMWAELLAELARELDPPAADAHWPEELARLAPSLPRRLGRPPATPEDVPHELARPRLFEAAVELTEYASADRPLVLVLDDVHLADPPSLELAAYVARRIARLGVLLVLSRRMVPRRDAVDALVHAARDRGVAVAEIELDPLDRREVERLVGTVAALDAPERERVIAAADGNPLLALESARAAARGDEGPPPSLRGAVRAAVARLSDPARRVAELTAVAGRDLNRTELAALATPEAVLEAMDCGLFRSADGRFGFRHALLREAVYADLDDARRLILHEALGTALVGQAAEAARHLLLARRDDLAADKLVQAAADAARATAFTEAAAYLREVIALRPEDPVAHRDLATALAQLGQREGALEALDTAVELMAPEDAAGRAAAHLGGARWFRSSLCHPVGARGCAQSGLDALDSRDLDEPRLRGELLLMRAWAEVTIAGAGAADETLREFETLDLDLDAHPLMQADLLTVRAFVQLATGHLHAAEALLAESGETAERAGNPEMAYGGWANAAILAAAAADLDVALEYAERGLAVVAGNPIIESEVCGIRAYILVRLGRVDEAAVATARQAELAALVASDQLAAAADHDAAVLAQMAGNHERAQELLAGALAGDPPVQRAEARLRRAESLARLGRCDEADAEIRAAALEPVLPAHRPGLLVARMAFAQALNARARGDLQLAERRLEEAARHWRRLLGPAGATLDYMATFVDFGRPPVTGVVNPEAELERVAAELRELETVTS